MFANATIDIPKKRKIPHLDCVSQITTIQGLISLAEYERAHFKFYAADPKETHQIFGWQNPLTY